MCGPLRRLPSPPRLTHLCLRCFSARSCFCRRAGAAAAGGGPLGRLPSPPPLTHFCLRCFSARSCFCEWLRHPQLLFRLAAGAFHVSDCGIVDSRYAKNCNRIIP